MPFSVILGSKMKKGEKIMNESDDSAISFQIVDSESGLILRECKGTLLMRCVTESTIPVFL